MVQVEGAGKENFKLLLTSRSYSPIKNSLPRKVDSSEAELVEEIGQETKQFILDCIDSLEQLEILLLLRQEPERCWSAEEVNAEIKSSVTSVRSRLETLANQGLLAREPKDCYRFSPPPLKVMVMDNLAQAYKEQRIRVIEMIFSKPSSPILGFADAFRLRKDKDKEK